MPPFLASILTWAFVFYLFRRDIAEKPNVTGAIWIPTLWLLIITTRAVSTWLGMCGISAAGISLEEGSTVDALVFFALICAGMRVLYMRRVSVAEVIRNNRWLTLYLLYCLTAVLWSDLPFVAAKRWIKDLGHPIMVLILLTEPDFTEALARLLKRCAYVVVPVSILYVKYYPEWGRGYNEWNGTAYYTGITESKNALGFDCLILGFFFIWHLLVTYRKEKNKARRDEIVLCIAFLSMIGWLFSMADSKTPLVSLTIALCVLAATGVAWINKHRIGGYILAAGLMIAAVELTFELYDDVLKLLGRDASLTERTPLWAELRRWGQLNPILGTGFESFWLGERREKIWKILRWNASQAHNGYLETYLNLGLVGLSLLLCLLSATYAKTRRALVNDYWFGRFRFSFLFAILAYNWTEASLYGLHPVFFMFFLIAIDYPVQTAVTTSFAQSNWPEPSEPASLLAHTPARAHEI